MSTSEEQPADDAREHPEKNSEKASEKDRNGPLSSLSPGARLAVAGIGVVIGTALIFLGLHSMEPETQQDIPSSEIVPTGVSVP